MNIAKIEHRGLRLWGIVEDDAVYALEGDRFDKPRKGAALAKLSEVKLLAPIEPGNQVIGLFANWKEKEGRDGPGFYVKTRGAIHNPFDPVIYPEIGKRVVFESEIGVVIGKTCRTVTREEA